MRSNAQFTPQTAATQSGASQSTAPQPTAPMANRDHASVGQMRERVENQARHIETLERCLGAALAKAGLESDTVVLLDRLPPLPEPAVPTTPQHVLPPRARDVATAADWWPAANRVPAPLPPEPGWACYNLSDRVGKVLGISLLGMSDDRVAATVDLIAAQQRKSRDFLPVFLTSSSAFHVFRNHGFVFEYLPPRPQRDLVEPTGDWQDYLADRLAFIARKWGMARVVCFGSQALGTW